MKLNYPIIDLHSHLRSDIPLHTKIAKKNGIDAVVYMANSTPALDSVDTIRASLEAKRHCLAWPVSAMTVGLEGKKLVDIDAIRDYVVGFSDDGLYLADLKLLEQALKKGVLIMAHCSPVYEEGILNPRLETEYIKSYLDVLSRVGGNLHVQHVSQASSVDLIRSAKKRGIVFTCETCPHYFTYTAKDLSIKTNPPLGTEADVQVVKAGLADGTIDVISSDYAPIPRITGIASYESFLPLSIELVKQGVLTDKQLRNKLHDNPLKIVLNNAGKVLAKNISMPVLTEKP